MTRLTVPLVVAFVATVSSTAVPQEAPNFPSFSNLEANGIAISLRFWATVLVPEQIVPQIPKPADKIRAMTAATNALAAIGEDGVRLTWQAVALNGPPDLSEDEAAHLAAAVDVGIKITVQSLASKNIQEQVRDLALGHGYEEDAVYDAGLDVLCQKVGVRRKIGKLGVNLVTVR